MKRYTVAQVGRQIA